MITITESQEPVLLTVKKFKGTFRPRDVMDALPDASRSVVDFSLKKFLEHGFIIKEDFGIYSTEPNLRNGNMKYEVGRNRQSIKNKKKPPAQVATAPAPVIQLSSTADKLANITSDVLKENSDLRNLLLQVHTTIGNALELNKPEE